MQGEDIPMFINMFRSRPKGSVPNSNAYDLLAEAVKHLQWDDDDISANLLYPSFTARDSREIVSEEDARCMDIIISKNRKVLELIEQSISKAVCVVPLTIGRDQSDPGVKEKQNVIAHITRLYQLYYIQTRSFIYKRRWKDALNAICRLFQFGDMLGGAWQDFLVETDGEFAKRAAFSAMVEMACNVMSTIMSFENCLVLWKTELLSPKYSWIVVGNRFGIPSCRFWITWMNRAMRGRWLIQFYMMMRFEKRLAF